MALNQPRADKSSGHVWQGRFKAFPIQQDEHLLAVLRYVERNPLRAKLVKRAENWTWSSLRERLSGEASELLHAGPVPLPRLWVFYCALPVVANPVNTAGGREPAANRGGG
jgi:putative transposase